MADSVTQLRFAGPVGAKKNIAILGDGFTAADQHTYNDWVDANVLNGLMLQDYFFEDASAFNIFRVNLESVDSGVTTHAVPDVGVSRSAPNPDPDAPPEQRGHHFTYYDTYEFDVRLPVAALRRANLGDVEVRYFRVKEPLDAPPRTDAPMRTQFERQLREVATLKGLPPEVLGR